MPDVKAGAKDREKECNADGRIHRINHEGFLALESGFNWIRILCRRCMGRHRISATEYRLLHS